MIPDSGYARSAGEFLAKSGKPSCQLVLDVMNDRLTAPHPATPLSHSLSRRRLRRRPRLSATCVNGIL